MINTKTKNRALKLAKKTAKGGYSIRCSYLGEKIYASGINKEACLNNWVALAEKHELEILTGVDELKPQKLFDELANEFIENYYFTSGATKVKTEKTRYRIHMSEFHNKLGCEINDDLIMKWYKRLCNRSVTINPDVEKYDVLSEDTINRVITLATRILNHLVNKKYVFDIDLTNVKCLKKIINSDDEKTIQIHTEEFNDIYYFIKSCTYVPGTRMKPIRYAELVRFLYETGLRIAEARAIKWSDIIAIEKPFTENGVNMIEHIAYVVVDKQMPDNKILYYTKTKKNRKVYLNVDYYDELMAYKMNEGYNDDDYILDVFKKGSPIARQSLSEALKKLIRALHEIGLVKGISEKISPQDFRISCSNNILDNENSKVAAKLESNQLGHTQATAQKYYERFKESELTRTYSRIREA